MRKMMRVVFTGGHAATTAIATIEELTKDNSKSRTWEIYWIGPKSAIEGKEVKPLEDLVFPRLGVITRSIIAGRLQMKFSIWTIPSMLKIPIGFLNAFWELIKIKPKLILSFGGYAAFPVVVAGFILRIPVIIHEQTATVGRANKFASIFARKIALARVESLNFFPKNKCVVTGNPILSNILEVSKKIKPNFPITVFVTGGSRGSQTINNLVVKILPKILTKYKLIHQTGPMDFKDIASLKKSLPETLSSNYQIHSRINPLDMDKIYKISDILVGRAGANTVSEIMAVRIPSILIPIPFSYQDEQTKNARYAEKFGIAKVIKQDSLTPASLFKEINYMAGNWNYYMSKTKRKISPDIRASEKLVKLLKETV